MAKTKEELDQLKQECESLASKLKELTDDELKQVTGGLSTELQGPIAVVAYSYTNLVPSIQDGKN